MNKYWEFFFNEIPLLFGFPSKQFLFKPKQIVSEWLLEIRNGKIISNLHFCNSIDIHWIRMNRKKEAFVGGIYARFVCCWFHRSRSIRRHSCVVLGRLIDLLFSLIVFERVLQILVVIKLNKCSLHTYIPALCKFETVAILSAAQTVNYNTS